MEERIVIQLGLSRIIHVQEMASVLLTVSGFLLGTTASVATLAGEEQSSGRVIVFRQDTEGDLAGESLERK